MLSIAIVKIIGFVIITCK